MSAIICVIFGGIAAIEIIGSALYNQAAEPSLSWLLAIVSATLMLFWGWRQKIEEKITINEFLQSGRQKENTDQESDKKD